MSEQKEDQPAEKPGQESALPAEQKTKLIPTKAERAFQLVQRKAQLLSESDLVPDTYKKKVGNCVIAIDLATRTGMDVLMVMQNLHIIKGKPSWSSTYVIAAINSSGRFSAPLNFDITGEGDSLSCVAFTTGKDGQRYEGPAVTMAMAKAEGWYDKKDAKGNYISKWRTMPFLMVRYRAAAFFGRLFTPELMLGMHTEDEVIDMGYANVVHDHQEELEELRAMFKEKEHNIPEEEAVHVRRILDNAEQLSFKKVRTILDNH